MDKLGEIAIARQGTRDYIGRRQTRREKVKNFIFCKNLSVFASLKGKRKTLGALNAPRLRNVGETTKL